MTYAFALEQSFICSCLANDTHMPTIECKYFVQPSQLWLKFSASGSELLHYQHSYITFDIYSTFFRSSRVCENS